MYNNVDDGKWWYKWKLMSISSFEVNMEKKYLVKSNVYSWFTVDWTV